MAKRRRNVTDTVTKISKREREGDASSSFLSGVGEQEHVTEANARVFISCLRCFVVFTAAPGSGKGSRLRVCVSVCSEVLSSFLGVGLPQLLAEGDPFPSRPCFESSLVDSRSNRFPQLHMTKV